MGQGVNDVVTIYIHYFNMLYSHVSPITLYNTIKDRTPLRL